MNIKFLFILFTVCLTLTSVCLSQNIESKITVDGIEREYIVHLPKYAKSTDGLPLVLVFHGGGGTASQIMNHSKFNKLSDNEDFVVVYPNAVDKNWNDGRIGDKLPMERDDIKFISNLIDTLYAFYKIDIKRVFSTGISNGGFFSIYLALKLSDKILAIAPVTASIPENLKDDFKTQYPVSMLLINGTKDPLVKYDGGPVGFKDDETGRGTSISTDWTVKIWVNNNGCQQSTKIVDIDNTDSDDGCTAKKYTYYKCNDNTEVVLVKITGGGHTWPGAAQYLPKILVGNVCKDFKATEMIWGFFKNRVSR
jgi:polyhydroxybutyrate depolymerase